MRKYKNQAGDVAPLLVIVTLIAAIACVVLVYLEYRKYTSQSKNTTSSSSEVSQPEESSTPATKPSGSLGVNSRNTARKNDASLLLANTAEYLADNNGRLTMPPVSVLTKGLQYYTAVSIKTGSHVPSYQDDLTLVLGAICGEDGVTVAGSARAFAAQYSIEGRGNSYTTGCVDG